MPSSDAELEERGSGGEENSLGGGEGVDLYDAELLLPGDVPAHDIPGIIQGQCQAHVKESGGWINTKHRGDLLFTRISGYGRHRRCNHDHHRKNRFLEAEGNMIQCLR